MSHINRVAYHTQEERGKTLTEPLLCTKDNAWLGEGYYYWTDAEFAIIWGRDNKKRTGTFVIYSSLIESDNFFNTVFNEEDYNQWIGYVEKLAKSVVRKFGVKPKLKEVSHFISELFKKKVDGIMFQDVPENDDLTYISDFFYRKRIQIVIYNLKTVKNFIFYNRSKI
jgi:hypothetical protein